MSNDAALSTEELLESLNRFADVLQSERSPSAVVAAFEAVRQACSAADELNGQLLEALESRDLIGQAKGIIMERERVDANAAFDILKTTSQRANRKLRAIAQDVVDSVARR